MHELAIMQSVVAVCEREAAEKGFRRVERIDLAVGALSGFEPECMFEFSPQLRWQRGRGRKADDAGHPRRHRVSGLRLLGRGEGRRMSPMRGLELQTHAGQGILY